MYWCGIEVFGWFNGIFLKIKNVGEVNWMVCFYWKYDCCYWKVCVKVCNCGYFYFFYLKWKNLLEEKYKYWYCGNGGGKVRYRIFEWKGDIWNCFLNCKF